MLRQTRVSACHYGTDHPLIIVGLKAAVQMDQLLGVVWACLRGGNELVRQQVVQVGCPRCSRVAKVADLGWRWPMSQNPGPRAARQTGQIDDDIDLQCVNALRGRKIAVRGEVYEMIEGACDAPSKATDGGRLQRQGKDFEARAIELLENAREQIRHGVFTQITR